MSTIFWFTATAIYFRVNPPQPQPQLSFTKKYTVDDLFELGVFNFFKWDSIRSSFEKYFKTLQ
jgi:hypothetical protein